MYWLRCPECGEEEPVPETKPSSLKFYHTCGNPECGKVYYAGTNAFWKEE